MKPVLQAIYNVLTQDPELAGLLSGYGGSPAVFLGVAPEKAQPPYVVLRVVSCVPEDPPALSRMVLAADVFDRSNSAVKALQVMARIEKLLDYARPTAQGLTIASVLRDFGELVPEDDREIQHGHLEFTVLFGREDIYG